MPEANEKQNLEEYYKNKHQKHSTWSYDYKLLCVNNKFSKPFKAYLGDMLFTILLIEDRRK